MTNATITATALAERFGVTTRTSRDLKKRGIIVAVGSHFALPDSVRSEPSYHDEPERGTNQLFARNGQYGGIMIMRQLEMPIILPPITYLSVCNFVLRGAEPQRYKINTGH